MIKSILFSASMIRALLAKRKSQTRRILKPQPVGGVRQSPFSPSGLEDGHGRTINARFEPGDKLWVRESMGWDKTTCRLFYCADDATIEAEQPNNYCIDRTAIPSIYMPRWASRLTLQVTGVKASGFRTSAKMTHELRASKQLNFVEMNTI